MVCTVRTDWEFLQTLYSEDDLHVMKEYGLDLHRVVVFIACTLIVGGTIAKVTLMVANTIRTTMGDPDANFVGCTFCVWGNMGEKGTWIIRGCLKLCTGCF